ncbi:hypothetical protein FOFC_07873 [Fusarium oxysporum]|nr:hypothetical protein FOFC_07873 [Fusarium oxysporum]
MPPVETPKGTPTGESDKEDGELEDGLFIVETIKNHATDKNGNLMFQVKWKGFESKKDLTWEPEDNLNTRPKRLQRNEAHVGNKTLLAVMKKWSPPSGSWEDEIEKIDACEEDENGKLIVYLIWKNGQKTNHGTQIIYEKCPQKMLQFYEEHVKITGKEKCHERRHEGLLGGVIP